MEKLTIMVLGADKNKKLNELKSINGQQDVTTGDPVAAIDELPNFYYKYASKR